MCPHRRRSNQPLSSLGASANPRASKGVTVLRLGHRLGPALRSGDPADAVPGPSAMALQRTDDDVLWHALDPLDAELLGLADGRRTELRWIRTAAQAASETEATARVAAAELMEKGLIGQVTRGASAKGARAARR